ncbi:MAG: glycosyltransferase family 4 protein [Treponema sp.]|jgi:glycosyltransferase involved in cell wall biosynthesis|nr:glycosyltransferase family 4 protein [Treponema sp.]
MSSCIILYHYYYPDDVVSSRHFTDFAESLHSNGWNVEVFTGARYCRRKGVISTCREIYNGVHIQRFKHPSFSQLKNIGRLLNSFCLSIKWFFALLFQHADVVIFGTDPQFSFFIIPFLSFFRPALRFSVWGFDLYPEAIVADGIKLPGFLIRLFKWWAGISYRRCRLLVDIGSCMRKRFLSYHPRARLETIVPWALDEPEIFEEQDSAIRYELFGNVALGILYSGTIGHAHQFEEFIILARELRKRNVSISFCFAGQGNKYKDLQNMITPEDSNITFAGFVDEKLLPLRLASADIHMISLRHGWEGVVVPSKFFGSLAAGRPLLYCGTPNSCIAELIHKEGFGFIIEMNNIKVIADQLEELSHNKSRLQSMQKAAFSFYKKYFSKEIQCKKWDRCLKEYIR